MQKESALAELGSATGGLEAVLNRSFVRFSLIFRAFWPLPSNVAPLFNHKMGTQDTLILLSKGVIYHTYKFFRFIILYLRVNVHRCLAVFMPSKILDSFWINASIQQVSNIGVAKLMWGHIKVNGIHQLRIVFLVFPRGGCYGAFDALAIYILIIVMGFRRANGYILPNSLELRIRKWLPSTVCNHIFRYGCFLDFAQTSNQAFGNGNISPSRLRFQRCGNHRPVMF